MCTYRQNTTIFISNILAIYYISKISPVTGLEWTRGFQEVKVPRLRENGPGWW